MNWWVSPRFLTIGLLVGSLGVAGVQALWPSSSADPVPPPPIEIEQIAQWQLGLDQAVLALRGYAQTGGIQDRFDYQQHLVQFRQALELVETGVTDSEAQRELQNVRTAVNRIEALGREAVALEESQGGPVNPAKLDELTKLREESLRALVAFRNVAVRRAAAAEPSSLPRLFRGAAAASVAAAALAVGALTLWSRLTAG